MSGNKIERFINYNRSNVLMYQLKVNPNRILLSEPSSHRNIARIKSMIDSWRDKGLDGIDPTLVFEMPSRYRTIADHVLFDGNHRTEAARILQVELPIMVLEHANDLRNFKQYNHPEFTSNEHLFQMMKKDYILDALELYRSNK